MFRILLSKVTNALSEFQLPTPHSNMIIKPRVDSKFNSCLSQSFWIISKPGVFLLMDNTMNLTFWHFGCFQYASQMFLDDGLAGVFDLFLKPFDFQLSSYHFISFSPAPGRELSLSILNIEDYELIY